MEQQKHFREHGYVYLKDSLDKKFIQDISDLVMETKDTFFSPDGIQVVDSDVCYSHPLAEMLLEKLLPVMEQHTGLALCPTYSFVRYYRDGNILKRHTDRPSCEISTTLCLDYEADELWPIGAKYGQHPEAFVTTDRGEMMIYRGCDVEHWREPFKGKWWLQVFLHYIDKDGPHFPEFKFDKRLGIPSLTIDELRHIKLQPRCNLEMHHRVIGTVDGAISAETCDALLKVCKQYDFKRSRTKGPTTEGEVNPHRTSHELRITGEANLQWIDRFIYTILNMGIKMYCDELNRSIYGQELSSEKMRICITNDEGYSLLRYRPGEYYKIHLDQGVRKNEEQGGMRLISALLYLNDDFEGGETHFYHQDFRCVPKKGRMVFFPSSYTHPHQSCPVKNGTKYAVVTWFA